MRLQQSWENILGSQREEIPSGGARERFTAEETLDLGCEGMRVSPLKAERWREAQAEGTECPKEGMCEKQAGGEEVMAELEWSGKNWEVSCPSGRGWDQKWRTWHDSFLSLGFYYKLEQSGVFQGSSMGLINLWPKEQQDSAFITQFSPALRTGLLPKVVKSSVQWEDTQQAQRG